MDTDRHGSAIRVALGYALFGVVWIFVTDLLAERWAASQAQLRQIQTVKGWLFVLASAILVYLLVRLHDRGRRQALEEAREAERRMRRAQRIGRIGNWEYDLRSERLYWSDEIYEIFGVDPASFDETRDSFYEFVHPDDLEAQKAADASLIAGRGPLDHEHRIVRPDGEVRHVHERAVLERGEEGEPIRVSGTVQDVTERKRLERELERSEEAIRRYSRYLLRAREEERRTLARELHDELGQTLTALRIQLGQLREETGGAGEEESAERLRASRELADEAMREMRRVVDGLRPGVLNELGLVDALRHLAERYAGSADLELSLELPAREELHLDGDRSIHVYRIAQEALTNVVRHAGADRVWLRLARAGDALELRVADDGRGLDAEAAWAGSTHGLVGMEERARLLGGELAVGESAEGGTEVTLRAPVEEP